MQTFDFFTKCLIIFVLIVGVICREDRIYGGDSTNLGDYPWHCALIISPKIPGVELISTLCGCTILSSNYVLTAARCCDVAQLLPFKPGSKDTISPMSINPPSGTPTPPSATNPSWMTVKVGTLDYKDTNAAIIHSVVGVKIYENILNGGYNPANGDHDLCMLTISQSKPIVFNDNVQAATLYSDLTIDLEHMPGSVAGWGKTSQDSDPSEVLEFAPMSIIKIPECNSVDYNNDAVTSNMFCTLNDLKSISTSSGDTGGSFVIEIDSSSKGVVAGVVSYCKADSGSDKTMPSVFAKIPTKEHLDWFAGFPGLSYI